MRARHNRKHNRQQKWQQKRQPQPRWCHQTSPQAASQSQPTRTVLSGSSGSRRQQQPRAPGGTSPMYMVSLDAAGAGSRASMHSAVPFGSLRTGSQDRAAQEQEVWAERCGRRCMWHAACTAVKQLHPLAAARQRPAPCPSTHPPIHPPIVDAPRHLVYHSRPTAAPQPPTVSMNWPTPLAMGLATPWHSAAAMAASTALPPACSTAAPVHEQEGGKVRDSK